MAATTKPDTIVIIDDEIHNMEWMSDYLVSKGFRTILFENVNEAVEGISKEIYRAVIVDLNIPCLPPLDAAIESRGALYARFPGLYVAWYARNRGYRDRQVNIYSVHKDPSVAEEANRLSCSYILKGRPREIKLELDSVVGFDPTSL